MGLYPYFAIPCDIVHLSCDSVDDCMETDENAFSGTLLNCSRQLFVQLSQDHPVKECVMYPFSII